MQNIIKLIGVVEQRKCEISRFFDKHLYYCFVLKVQRLSGYVDKLNIICRKDSVNFKPGDRIFIFGRICSKSVLENGHNRLVLYVKAKVIKSTDQEDLNAVEISGKLCKKPIYRTTPLGRQISDILIISNKKLGKSDYIPSIAWDKNARKIKDCTPKTFIHINGRLQSREYTKKNKDNSVVRTAFEVSIDKLSIEEDI